MVIKEEVFITPFDDYRTLHIYVPNNVEISDKCEVIYMFDGHNLFYDEDATYGTSWGLKNIFDKNKKKVIIVGIECNHTDNERLFEFSPYTYLDGDFGLIQGKGDSLFKYIIEELKPYIEKKYPVSKSRKNTAIAGSSMGGLMALYGAIKYSDYFAKAICVSPHILYNIDQIIDDINQNQIRKDTMVYISYGSNELKKKKDLLSYTDDIFKIQRSLDNRVKLFIHLFINHGHNEKSWRKEVKYWLKDLNY